MIGVTSIGEEEQSESEGDEQWQRTLSAGGKHGCIMQRTQYYQGNEGVRRVGIRAQRPFFVEDWQRDGGRHVEGSSIPAGRQVQQNRGKGVAQMGQQQQAGGSGEIMSDQWITAVVTDGCRDASSGRKHLERWAWHCTVITMVMVRHR